MKKLVAMQILQPVVRGKNYEKSMLVILVLEKID